MSRFRIVEKLGDVKIKGWGTQIWSLKQDQRLAGKSALMVRHPKETLSPLVTFNTLLTQLNIDFASWSLCLWKLGNSRESQDKSFPTSQRFSSQYQFCWREALIMIEVWSLVLYSCSCVFVCVGFTLCSYKPCACHVVFWSNKKRFPFLLLRVASSPLNLFQQTQSKRLSRLSGFKKSEKIRSLERDSYWTLRCYWGSSHAPLIILDCTMI